MESIREPEEVLARISGWKIFSLQFEVSVRVRLNIETLSLILKPQSVAF